MCRERQHAQSVEEANAQSIAHGEFEDFGRRGQREGDIHSIQLFTNRGNQLIGEGAQQLQREDVQQEEHQGRRRLCR